MGKGFDQINMFKKLWDKFKKFLFRIKTECRDLRTIVLFVIVCAVVYSPVWLGFTIFAVFGFKWALIAATTCCAFWAGPFTPFFPICIALTFAIKRLLIFKKNRAGSEKKSEE